MSRAESIVPVGTSFPGRDVQAPIRFRSEGPVQLLISVAQEEAEIWTLL